jgi:hypothetical protein
MYLLLHSCVTHVFELVLHGSACPFFTGFSSHLCYDNLARGIKLFIFISLSLISDYLGPKLLRERYSVLVYRLYLRNLQPLYFSAEHLKPSSCILKIFTIIRPIELPQLKVGPTQPPIQWVTRAISPGVKRPGREADHSPASSAEVKECVELYLHFSNRSSWRGV